MGGCLLGDFASSSGFHSHPHALGRSVLGQVWETLLSQCLSLVLMPNAKKAVPVLSPWHPSNCLWSRELVVVQG